MPQYPVFSVLKRLLHPERRKLPLLAGDKELLECLDALVQEHRADSEFTTTAAAEALGMSRMNLNRKLQGLTGHSTHQYILEKRLESARELLAESVPVGFVARSVGFKSASQFAKAFKRHFGGLPSVYRGRRGRARLPRSGKDSGG